MRFYPEKGGKGVSGVKNGDFCFGVGSSFAFIRWLHFPWNEGDLARKRRWIHSQKSNEPNIMLSGKKKQHNCIQLGPLVK